MARSKGRQYRGFTIQKDQTDRFNVLTASVADGEPTLIAVQFQTVSLAMEWIDQTQFDGEAS